MRKLINILLTAAIALTVVSCYTADTDTFGESQDARISISPTEISFTADGRTSDGLSYGTYIVTVNPIDKRYYDWTAELLNADWATLDYYTTDSGGVVEKTLRITCTANIDWTRTGTLRITLNETGETADFSVVQSGLKEDATLELTKDSFELMAIEPDVTVISYETNMPKSTVGYSVAYDDESGWLSCVLDTEECTLTVTAEENNDMSNARTAVITMSAGTTETSYVEKTIGVTQYANVIYLFMYGSALPRYATFDNAVQMTKSDLLFNFKQYFRNGTLIVTTSRSEDSYPHYAVNSNGTLTELADAAAEASAPEISFDIAGVNTVTINLSTDENSSVIADQSTVEFTRVSTTNCLPDSEVDSYSTKEYVTRNGGTKTWMTTNLHWNGGSSMGTYKLGSGLVAGSQTGGYNISGTTGYDTRLPAYDTEENGGTLKELLMDDGVTTRASVYGRLYSTYEALTGSPTGALSDAMLMSYPLGDEGDVIMDAIGTEITLEPLLVATVGAYTASDDGDAQAEADHPSLCMQLQGICPYGWHIANMQDWRDLVYAAAQHGDSQYAVSASSAYYGALGGGSVANFGAMLRCQEWLNSDLAGTTSPVVASGAADFGFNIYPNGWRLFKTGYDYGSESNNPRVYHMVPMMGQTTSSKMAVWRFYFTQSAAVTIDDGFDIGNGSGNPVRCVKNYENF